jgi:hypothetical protein
MEHHLSTRLLAAVLALALVGVLSPVRAETLASLSGRVLSEDARTPLSGVVIRLTGPSDAILKSDPTTADGLFTLGNLPPGVYRCTVETGEGLYQVTSSLKLEPGQSRSVQLALKKDQQPVVAGVGSATGGGAGGGGAHEYAPLVGIGVILGTLGLAAALDSDDNKKGSPSSPAD